MLRKNLSVLWAMSDPGIVLQNLNTHTFCELNEIQEKIWAYLDGTHGEQDIIELLTTEFWERSSEDIRIMVETTIELLRENGFIFNSH
jgi:hypothetical protein